LFITGVVKRKKIVNGCMTVMPVFDFVLNSTLLRAQPNKKINVVLHKVNKQVYRYTISQIKSKQPAFFRTETIKNFFEKSDYRFVHFERIFCANFTEY